MLLALVGEEYKMDGFYLDFLLKTLHLLLLFFEKQILVWLEYRGYCVGGFIDLDTII